MLYFCMCTYMSENISHKIYWVTRIYFIGNLEWFQNVVFLYVYIYVREPK